MRADLLELHPRQRLVVQELLAVIAQLLPGYEDAGQRQDPDDSFRSGLPSLSASPRLNSVRLSSSMSTARPSSIRGAPDGTATRFVLGCTEPLTSGHASAVNVVVNENRAKLHLSLIC